MKTIKAVDTKINNLLKIVTADKYDAMNDKGKEDANSQMRVLNDERELLKKERADLHDVKDSLSDLTLAIPDVDLAKASNIANTLFSNKISKWELHVATAEIIRSRHQFHGASEYFHAITRIKIKLTGSNCNIFNEKALDF
jgi:hypothetical protein